MTDTAVPRITVLVPIYNVEGFLRECLDSVCAQTFTDFEAICINDGSTDGSREIIQDYLDRDRRFRVIDKANSGYGASMNQGLAAAKGEYIAILESDDYFVSDALEILYRKTAEYNAQVAKGNSVFFWTKPVRKEEHFDLVPVDQTDCLVDPQQKHEIFYLKPSIWSALYRRDFLLQNEISFLETPGASYQDASFNFKVWVAATRVVFVKDDLVFYRQDNQNSSVNSVDKAYCVVEEYAEMQRYLDKRQAPQWLYNVKTKMKYDTYMWNYERLSDALKLQFLKHMSDELARDLADGYLDKQYFYDWDLISLATILDSPEEFHTTKQVNSDAGYLAKIKMYYQAGGLPLLFRVFKRKLQRT